MTRRGLNGVTHGASDDVFGRGRGGDVACPTGLRRRIASTGSLGQNERACFSHSGFPCAQELVIHRMADVPTDMSAVLGVLVVAHPPLLKIPHSVHVPMCLKPTSITR